MRTEKSIGACYGPEYTYIDRKILFPFNKPFVVSRKREAPSHKDHQQNYYKEFDGNMLQGIDMHESVLK